MKTVTRKDTCGIWIAQRDKDGVYHNPYGLNKPSKDFMRGAGLYPFLIAKIVLKNLTANK